MAPKKTRQKKPAVKLPDLPPQKDPQGGYMHSNTPPLPIPPPGFISNQNPSEL